MDYRFFFKPMNRKNIFLSILLNIALSPVISCSIVMLILCLYQHDKKINTNIMFWEIIEYFSSQYIFNTRIFLICFAFLYIILIGIITPLILWHLNFTKNIFININVKKTNHINKSIMQI